ncbi:hypothetical protein [Stenotrophomonas maltophilia]
MTTPTEEILERLGACKAGLEAHRGYLKALEYGLRATVISHPDPSQLSRTWNALLPGIAEKHADDGGPVFAAAITQVLMLLTEQMDEASRRLDRSSPNS